MPPHETSAAPMTVAWSTPRYFGLTPPMLLFGLATATLAIAIALAILARWVGALLLAAVSLFFVAVFVGVARRKPDAFARSSARAVERMRERTSWLVEAVAIRSSAGHEVMRLRHELLDASEHRDSLLRELGLAVYQGDDSARQKVTDELAALDEGVEQKEAEMQTIAEAAEERIHQGRVRVQPTLIDPPQPSEIPEPSPPPDEGTPPTPPLVPEPYPPPDEGTPPMPAPVPEPGPGGPEPERDI